MKRILREDVFETNSSSAHVFVVKNVKDEHYTTDEIMDGVWISKNGELHLWDHDLHFGRSPFDILDSFGDKLKYAFANLVRRIDSEEYNILYETCKEVIPEFTKFDFDKHVHEVRKDKFESEDEVDKFLEEHYPLLEEDKPSEYWEYDEEDEEDDNWRKDYWFFEYYNFGSVDDYMLKGWLEKEGISLKEFLLNKRYCVVVDGDEYCIWDKLKDSGMIDKAMIEKEY